MSTYSFTPCTYMSMSYHMLALDYKFVCLHVRVVSKRFPKFKAGIAAVVGAAVVSGRLKGRPGKQQFEIFSADWMLDAEKRPWLIEFNFGPVSEVVFPLFPQCSFDGWSNVGCFPDAP